MAKIHILDIYTANQIAAGEVVERPASVVKELVENSIDADSTSITVEIKDGGISYIRVTDNGSGIEKDDVKLAFERHATSKITNSKDLRVIRSLGFRGEALASIAAVSQVDMMTRTRDNISGIALSNYGGEIKACKEAGCPEGTTIIVRNLFFNTPARLKFLKKHGTEAGYISDIVSRLILANPHISFKFINNGKTIYHSPGDGDLYSAIYSVYGKEVVSSLLKVKFECETMKLKGYIGNNQISRSNRNHQSLFINGRYIKSELVTRTIESAYETYLTVNRFPFFVLHMYLPFDKVDVNVHPNKMDVRFIDEDKIEEGIRLGITETLSSNFYIPNALDDHSASDKDSEKEKASVAYQNELVTEEDNISSEDGIQYIDIPSHASTVRERNKNEVNVPGEDSIFYKKDDNNNKDSGPCSSGFTIIGQMFHTYILIEQGDHVYIIDQHAAHERILYEKYKKMLESGSRSSQHLLIPYIIEVTHQENEMIQEHISLLEDMGFQIEEFGSLAYQVRAVPYILGQPQVKDFFMDLVDRLNDIGNMTSLKLKQDAIMQLACKNAVKAGKTLSEPEIKGLLKLIQHETIPLTCPHGRPIVVAMTKYDLEKRFKRVQ